MQLILKNAPCANPNSSLNRGKKMSLSDGKIKRDNFTSRWGFVLAVKYLIKLIKNGGDK